MEDVYPEPEPEPEVEPEPEPEPEGEPTAEPEDDPCLRECYAEPSPDWKEAKDDWKEAWEIHVYGVGIAFAVIGLYALICVIRLTQQRNLLSKGYFISLNAMLLVLCVSRAVFLLVDGYNSANTFHPIVAYLLYSLGFPSLTSAFSILFLALLRTLKMEIMSPKIQSARTLIAIISVHFSISVLTDMILGYYFDSRITSMVCQVASLVWGTVLVATYLYTFRRLYSFAVHQQSDLSRYSVSDLYEGSRKKPRVVMNLALKVTLITALLGFLNMGIHIYGMVDVMNVFTNAKPDPWPWWILHFTLRFTEIAMAALMLFVASQPFRYPNVVHDKDHAQWFDSYYFISCFRICQFPAKDDSCHQLQMTAHQESLLRSQSSYCHAQINHNMSSTPNLDGHHQPRVIDNKLFIVVEDVSGSSSSRPTSMLIQEDVLIRFRMDDDPPGEPIASTDDELDAACRNTNENCGNESAGAIIHEGSHSAPEKESVPARQCAFSLPNTGSNTPATPRSFMSVDPEDGVFTFRPPSSIHLRASIEGALDCSDVSLKSPGFSDFEGFSLPEEFEDADEEQAWNPQERSHTKKPTSSAREIPKTNKHYHKMKSKDSLNAAYSPLSEDDERYTVAEVREFLMKTSLYGPDYLSHIKSQDCDHGTHV
jgi:hypothetical protein